MARKKKSRAERVADEIRKLFPKGIIPDTYIDYVVTDNDEYADSEEELTAEVKMQLFEESGIDIPMTRKEVEMYLTDMIDDGQWEGLNHDGHMLTSQVKMVGDSYDKTMLEMIRELPLIPASRIISSIVVSYLKSHGQEISDERAEEITEDMIHSLNTSFSDMAVESMGDLEDTPDWGGGFDLSFDFDDGQGLPFTDGTADDSDSDPDRPRRRSRITKFPGKK